MLRVGIWVESFRYAGILLLQWQRENFAHWQHLKFCHFQHVHCASKNPISRNVFTRFSKCWPQLEDVEGGHLGGNFQGRRYFTFAMATWKFCALTTFEILPLSTCTLCQQKSYISKGIHTIFEIFASAGRCWGWVFGWKVSGAQVFYFCNGNVKTLRIDKIWNFATFNMYTVPAKILYLQRYSHDFRNVCVSSKMFSMRIWVGSLRRTGVFLLQWQGENFAYRKHLKFWNFQPVHCASKNPISLKVFNRFSKSLPKLEDVEGGIWVKVSGVQVFYFCNGKVKRFPIDNIWIFATFNLFPVPAKILCLQSYSTNFGNLCLSSKMLRVGMWVESFTCAGILLLQWQAKIFRIDNIWNFATFNLFPVPAKILCLQRYSTNFRNLWLSSEMLRVAICVESFRYARVLLLQCQGENFSHRQHLKFCHFRPVHCASKNPMTPKVFTGFSKSLPQLEDVEGGHLGGKFQVRRYFTFAMASENISHRQNLKFCHVQPVPGTNKNPISPKAFNRFSKSLPQLEDVQYAHLSGKFKAHRYFSFAMARWKLCVSKTFEILELSTCTLCEQKSYIPKCIQPIF